MQKFHFDFDADAEGLRYYNLALRALHNPRVAEIYEYKVEELPNPNGNTPTMHRITWWRRYTGEQR